MDARVQSLFAVEPSSGWLIDQSQIASAHLILLSFVSLVLLIVVLAWLGVIDWVLGIVGIVIRSGIRTGFGIWKQFFSWTSWPIFLSLQLGLLAAGVAITKTVPAIAIAFALAPLGMGLAACLTYMFIDIERYEVARGHKALHDPMKGQRLAPELTLYGNQVGVPLLAASAVGMIGGFSLLNFALYQLLGSGWYRPHSEGVHYPDFVASALIHLLSAVDLLNLANTTHLAQVTVARPANPVASTLLTLFRSFFSLVLIQQIFASVRNGRLLAEIIADFWSPHEPIHVRARNALPQYGAGALGPLLLSLRSAETLNREQREQLPRILATIGPASIAHLKPYLDDQNEHVRAVVVSTLGRLHATAALPQLARMVNDSSDLVRLSLAEALGIFSGPVSDKTTRQSRPHRRVWQFLRRHRKADPLLPPAAIAIPALQMLLEDPSAAIRAEAVRSLGQMGPANGAAVTSNLIQSLADADETVRVRGAEALGQIGSVDTPAISALTGMLDNPSAALRIAAAQSLGAIGSPAAMAVPILVSLLQDRDEEVSKAAAEAVGRIGILSDTATHSLTQGLESTDSVVRARTAEALGDIGEAAVDTASALVAAAEDGNDRVRAKAIEALGKIGESTADVAVPRLVRALRDPDNWVSALAAEALGEMGAGADEAIPALVRSLRHTNPLVRSNTAEALGKLGSAAVSAIPSLEQAAEDADGGVRVSVLRALGEIGQPRVESIRIVRSALADPDPHLRSAAIEAFGIWGKVDESTSHIILGLFSDPNDEVKAWAVRTLPKISEVTAEVVDGLVLRLAEDDCDWVRVEAARALGQIGAAATSAGPALLRAARTGEAGLREEAMRALVVAQPPEAAEAFTAGISDAEPQVRKLASAGWRKAVVVPEEAVPALIEALHDPETQVRANAAYALGRLDPGPTEAIPSLVECLIHPDAGLRLNAAFALQSLPGRAAADAVRTLLNDPNPRIRLIAARRALVEDGTDKNATMVVAAALADSSAVIRRAAADLVSAVGFISVDVLALVQSRLADERDPAVSAFLHEAVGLLETNASERKDVSQEAGVIAG